MILRDEYYLDGLKCDPFTFASECQELNSYYHKKKKFNEMCIRDRYHKGRALPGVLRRIYPYCGSYDSRHICFCMQGTVW